MIHGGWGEGRRDGNRGGEVRGGRRREREGTGRREIERQRERERKGGREKCQHGEGAFIGAQLDLGPIHGFSCAWCLERSSGYQVVDSELQGIPWSIDPSQQLSFWGACTLALGTELPLNEDELTLEGSGSSWALTSGGGQC